NFADAFFPLALLHWGHHETLQMSFSLQMVASTALAGAWLMLLTRRTDRPLGRAIWLILPCLLGLGLTGASGLVFVPALALWLASAGWRGLRSRDVVRGMTLLGLAALGAAVVVFYYADYHAPEPVHQRSDLVAAGRTGLQFLGMWAGLAGIRYWPWPAVAAA